MKTTKEISKSLRFLEMPEPNMVGYKLSNHAGYDEWEEIVVLFNGNEKPARISLAHNKWAVVVNGNQAGTEVIEILTASEVDIDGRTAMVLVKI